MTLSEMIEREVSAAVAEVRAAFTDEMEGQGIRLMRRVKHHGAMISKPTERQRSLLKWIANYRGIVPPHEMMMMRWDVLGGLLSRGLVRLTAEGQIVVTAKGRKI